MNARLVSAMASWFWVFSMDTVNCARVLVSSLARWSSTLFCVSRSAMWLLRLVIWPCALVSEFRVSASAAAADARLLDNCVSCCALKESSCAVAVSCCRADARSLE